MIKVIKEGEGSIVAKGQETILLAGSTYGGGNLGKNIAIIGLSELGSGLFCAKATLQSENSCLSWLQELKEALGNEITFHLTGKQSKEDLAELQILCQQAEIEAQFPIPEKQPLLYSLATGVNANGVIEKADLDVKTGGFSFSLTLTKEIEQAISELEKKIKDSWFTINTKGRTDSIVLLKELKQNLEQLGESYIGPVNSESDLKFPKSLKEAIKDYSGSEAKNGRQQTTTVGGLLKTLDFHFTQYTVLTTKFTQTPAKTVTWHASEPSADTDNKGLDTPTKSAPPPPPAELKADAKARREAAALANAMELADDNTEDLPPPPPSSPGLQQPLSDNNSDFLPPPPPPLSDEEQMLLTNFDNIELPPPPPSMSSDIAQETQNPVAVVEPEAKAETEVEAKVEAKSEEKTEEKVTEAVKPKTEVRAINAAFPAITARRAAVEGSDSEDSDSDSKSNEGEDEMDSNSSTLFQRQQSQSQEADNSNPLQYN
ncbi:hypothetical protein [Piscirickettsia salmonis]|nr:hypothetical protein [Piscirickettsia salmonis]QGO52662.1 hypothetical protein Psal069_02055 [Piscirickettsia salmonis]